MTEYDQLDEFAYQAYIKDAMAQHAPLILKWQALPEEDKERYRAQVRERATRELAQMRSTQGPWLLHDPEES